MKNQEQIGSVTYKFSRGGLVDTAQHPVFTAKVVLHVDEQQPWKHWHRLEMNFRDGTFRTIDFSGVPGIGVVAQRIAGQYHRWAYPGCSLALLVIGKRLRKGRMTKEAADRAAQQIGFSDLEYGRYCCANRCAAEATIKRLDKLLVARSHL